MFSIILPTYNEKDNLVELHRCLSTVADKASGSAFEFVFVDDCSSDDSPEILRQIARNDKRVKIIRLARNCGSHAAVAAGLDFCGGDAAIMLAADLQDPPEIILQLLQEWRNGAKVVWGVRERREGESLFVVKCSQAFYFLMNRLTSVSQASSGADVFLIDRSVIDAFKASREKNTSVYMLIAWLGFPQTSIRYVKQARHSGRSKWSTSKRIKLFVDSLVSFSYAPLRLMSLAGAISAGLGFVYGLVVVINAFAGHPIRGWSSLMVVVLLLGGFQISMLGILGEYLWRTYDETRGRPRYVIESNAFMERQPERKAKEPVQE